MKKITFRLDIDDGWPPVAAESIWCEEVGELYRICNSPFFVKNLSFGDVVCVSSAGLGEVFIEKVVQQSGNSTVWLYFQTSDNVQSVLADLHKLGCGHEGGTIAGYFSVNVPESVDMARVSSALDPLENSGDLFVAYSADRHSVPNSRGLENNPARQLQSD